MRFKATSKLDANVTYTRDVTFENDLPGRHRYVATRYENFPSYQWTVTAA
jgi:hypothetical protein